MDAFAERCLAAWLPRHVSSHMTLSKSARRELNSRLTPSEGVTLSSELRAHGADGRIRTDLFLLTGQTRVLTCIIGVELRPGVEPETFALPMRSSAN